MVYFIQSGKTGPVKIGHTSQSIECRLTNLQTGSAEQLYCLGTIKGARDIERAMHQKFSQYHLHREWFRPDRSLLYYIIDICHYSVKLKLYNWDRPRCKLDSNMVVEALSEARGNKSKAAHLLNVGRATLYRFLNAVDCQ